MKKLWQIVISVTLALALVGCGASDKKDNNGGEQNANGNGTASGKGSVYWLNIKPESDTALQEVARLYTEKTGVPVKVVTAASGTYEQTLASELAKSDAPTLFVAGKANAIETWKDYCLDLTNTKVAKELNTDEYNFYKQDGALASIGYCYESYGIITNTKLLKKAGYELKDINNFSDLKRIAEDIHSRYAELGFDAFTSSGMDDSSSWRFSGHLANMPLYYQSKDAGGWEKAPATITNDYLDKFRNIWDLYINNARVEPSSLATSGYDTQGEFLKEEAVFYQNGSWEYDALKGLGDENLTMIPIYIGVEGEENIGLCSGTENCWAVNAKAPAEQVEATLEFMYWCVTDAEASRRLVDTFGVMPFKQAAVSNNKFLADANEYANAGKQTIPWVFSYTPNITEWRAGVVSAMNQYDANPSDENWKIVEKAFVQGWENQYKDASY